MALWEIGPEAIPALSEALKDEDTDHAAIAMALWEIGPEAIPALSEALKDEDRHVRTTAAYALSKINTPEAIKALEEDE